MNEQGLVSTLKELLAEVKALKAHTIQLQEKVTYLEKLSSAPPPMPPADIPKVTTNRRRMLKALATTLLAGAGAGLALADRPATVEAKVVSRTDQVGAIIAPVGDAASGSLPGNFFKYGLVVLSGTGNFDLSVPSNIFQADTAIFAKTSSLGVGVYASGGRTGVYGGGTNAGMQGDGGTYGVLGFGNTGVSGSGTGTGVYGFGDIYGVYGYGKYGVYGQDLGQSGYGVYANANRSTGTGVYANGATGVYGTGHYGVWGYGDYVGVYGQANGNTWAGYFEGKVLVTGQLAKPGGSFKIDHPLDPANKYLYHSFVESPDMLNLYNGIVTLDEHGQAEVEMPEWFEALNTDFRYGLTCLQHYAPVYIAQEIKDRKFKIAGGLPHQRISWQLTGVRQDEWAKANRIPVEEEKTSQEKGKYLHPEVYGLGPERSVSFGLGMKR